VGKGLGHTLNFKGMRGITDFSRASPTQAGLKNIATTTTLLKQIHLSSSVCCLKFAAIVIVKNHRVLTHSKKVCINTKYYIKDSNAVLNIVINGIIN